MAKLPKREVERAAKKLGEEAIEVINEMFKGDRNGVKKESLGLLYRIQAVWQMFGITHADMQRVHNEAQKLEALETLRSIGKRVRKRR